MGTHWEQQNFNTPTLPQKKENLGALGAYCLTSLAPRNFLPTHVFFFGSFLAYAYESGMNYYRCIIHALGTNECEEGSGKAFKLILELCNENKRCVTLWPLPFTLNYLKAKEELWTLKCFTMQKYNLQKIL